MADIYNIYIQPDLGEDITVAPNIPDRLKGIALDNLWKEIPLPSDVVQMHLNSKLKTASGESLITGKVFPVSRDS